jgi:hypothetical protein
MNDAQRKIEPKVRVWPFVESPGELAARLHRALDDFDGDMIAAVRCVFIEEPAALLAQSTPPPDDAGYYRWRLQEIIPLFEEARDALTALTVAQCKLRNIDLTLGDRMDRAGTRTRSDYERDAAPDSAAPPTDEATPYAPRQWANRAAAQADAPRAQGCPRRDFDCPTCGAGVNDACRRA